MDAAKFWDGFGAELERNGVKVKKVDGWKGAGTGGAIDPRSDLFHHTASNRNSGPLPSLGICRFGRPDLGGPLCNGLIGRNCDVVLIAAGRANHAGEGGPWRGIPEDSGNLFFVGWEVENDGIGEPWSNELLDTCATVFAVSLRRKGKTAFNLGGHKEWAPLRKIDPHPIAMPRFRKRVRKKLRQVKRVHRQHVRAERRKRRR